MPGIDKIHLEDALEDSPQTRSMVALFEKDAALLRDYVATLQSCCARVLSSHKELAQATSLLSSHLKAYKDQNFPLDPDPDSIVCTTLQQMAFTLDEMSSLEQSCSVQLGDAMMFPLNRFLDADLSEIFNNMELYHTVSAEQKQALSKYCKLSQRKDADKVWQEAANELFVVNQKFHQRALTYYTSLNSLQYKRRAALLEPLLGLLTSAQSHCNLHSQLLDSEDMGSFLVGITASVEGVHAELEQQSQEAVSQIEVIQESSQPLYLADQLEDQGPNINLSSKSGYLFHRSKYAGGMVTRWEQQYFYTVSGYLMVVNKDDIAGSVALEIDTSVAAQALPHEDRKNVFQISNGKKTLVLQAISGKDRDEWIATIHNIARDSLHHQKMAKLSLSSSTPDTPDTDSGPQSVEEQQSRSSQLLLNTPIQFDLISPTEESPRHNKDGPPPRINPFDQSGATIPAEGAKSPTSLFWEVFAARFLGSMEVPVDRGEKVVLETIRKILAARAIHNMFRTTEVHLVVDDRALRLMDSGHQTEKCHFNLEDISFWTFHKENSRLLGFITRSSDHSYHCHAFEAHVSAEEICSALSTAASIVLKNILEKKKVQQEAEAELNSNKALNRPPAADAAENNNRSGE